MSQALRLLWDGGFPVATTVATISQQVQFVE